MFSKHKDSGKIAAGNSAAQATRDFDEEFNQILAEVIVEECNKAAAAYKAMQKKGEKNG